MTITLHLFLDSRHTKQDGTQAIKYRLTIDRKSIEWSSGYAVPPKYWNDKNRTVKAGCPTVAKTVRLNHFLAKQKSGFMDRLLVMQDSGELAHLSLKEIKARLLNKSAGLEVLAYAESLIAEMKAAGRHGNARVYTTLLRSLRDFTKGKDVSMKRIGYAWLKRYEAWYLAKGNSLNGLSVVLRTLRAMFNRAIKEKRLSRDDYPFTEYKIKKEKTRKRAISREEIGRVMVYSPQTIRQKRAKEYFLIGFYLMGASFVDIAHLRVKDIIKGRIEYKRKKTGRLHSVPLSEPLQKLLAPYLEGKDQEAFILNVITSDDTAKQDVQVRDELRRYNRSLKEIGEICELSIPLSSYVVRHSYATIAKFKGVPIAVISEALGHANQEVTQIYLDSFDKEVLDKYHSQVIE